jgi:thioredoxin-related protein
MRILRTVSATVTALALTASAFASEGWLDNYPKALAQAKAEKKLLFIEFTGSDWCPPCQRQVAEVFAKQEFKDYAAKNLVLLEVDFPRTKELAYELKEHNRDVSSKYGIRSFPTIVLVDAEGQELARFSGYDGGGAAGLLAKLGAFRK